MDITKGGVAFFDSGIGGLTVLAECKKQLPNQTFYYFGDNLRAPYGNLPHTLVQAYVHECFEEIAHLQPCAAVVACNTATALCIESLRARYAFPVIGAEPAVLPAAKHGGKVFVLSTRATYESERLKRLCDKASRLYPNTRLILHPCDGLAGAIERRIFSPSWDVAPFLPTGNPDGVVLGCTHYIYLQKRISDFYQAPTYDGNSGIAKNLACILSKNLEKSSKNAGEVFFLGKAKWSNKYIYEQMFAYK